MTKFAQPSAPEVKKRGRPAKTVPVTQEIAPSATETAIVPQVPPKKELVLEGDPEAQLQFAMKAANALMRAVSQKAKPVMIRGEQYLEYGDWQTLARFFGATAAVEWTQPLKDEKTGKVLGYEARAQVLHQGQIISSAEAMCMREERNWRDRDEFMLRSMAQTRAAAKALRNAYGWVAELAGMKSTPAEEMDGVERESVKYEVKPAYPKFDSTNDAHGLMPDPKSKEVIKELLAKLNVQPGTLQSAKFDIKKLTNVFWKPGENDEEIIQKLQTRVDNLDSLAEFDRVVDAEK